MHNCWKESELQQLEARVSEFEEAAFNKRFVKASDRKRAMRSAARASKDKEIQHILGRSIDYLSQRPELVHSAIFSARGHIDTLRLHGPGRGQPAVHAITERGASGT